MRSFLASDRVIREILRQVRVIAIVGLEPDPAGPTLRVAQVLKSRGYRTLPVNARARGREILGETAVADLSELSDRAETVDLVAIADKTIDVKAAAAWAAAHAVRVLWMQPGVADPKAAFAAHQLGLAVVMNRCIAKEYEAQFPDDELL